MNNVEHTITVEELKQGSDLLFKQIYNDNRDKFINFARRYNVSHDDIIDVYQDAYVAFYNNVKSGKLEVLTSSVSTYLISIGKYLIFDKMKKNSKTINPDFDLTIVRKDEVVVDAFEIETEDLTTEQRLMKKHFATLGKQCQELLNLFYYRGFTIKDILELGKYNSENVIKSTKSRCMKSLKEKIIANPN
ncbi:RNA polymerase sigma factor [Lacinutrix salivirga]